MSDLQDLIHTNAHNAFEIGVRTERERIIKLLEACIAECGEMCDYCVAQRDAIDLIKEHK